MDLLYNENPASGGRLYTVCRAEEFKPNSMAADSHFLLMGGRCSDVGQHILTNRIVLSFVQSSLLYQILATLETNAIKAMHTIAGDKLNIDV